MTTCPEKIDELSDNFQKGGGHFVAKFCSNVEGKSNEKGGLIDGLKKNIKCHAQGEGG